MDVESFVGNMEGALKPVKVLTKRKRVAELAIIRIAKESVMEIQTERDCIMRNRMRQLRTSGSVRGEGSKTSSPTRLPKHKLENNFLPNAASNENAGRALRVMENLSDAGIRVR